MKRNILFILCYYCVLSLKRDAFALNVFVHKHSRAEIELLTAFGGEVVTRAVLAEGGLHIGVALEVVTQGGCNVFALRHDAHASGYVFDDFVHQQGVVRTTENEYVDLRVETHDAVDALLHEVVGTRRVVFKVFDQWHPHGAGQ